MLPYLCRSSRFKLLGCFLLGTIANQIVNIQLFRPYHSHETVTTSSSSSTTINDSARTTFLWKYGALLLKDQENHDHTNTGSPITTTNYTIDAATMGCHSQSSLMQAQVSTWAKGTVRYFFGSTEDDDVDSTCHSTMTLEMLTNVSHMCGSKARIGPELQTLSRAFYARGPYLLQKSNPTGWLCAQQRFASLLGKVGLFYSQTKELPDYLFVQDDDTYVNIKLLERDLLDKVKDPSIPFAAAGCVIHMPIHMMNFSFPFGGFGMILSRGAIARMMHPIHCNTTSTSTSTAALSNDMENFVAHACHRLQKNTFGELSAFVEGMSVAALMQAHVAANPYRDYEQWVNKPGYCFHGDWVLGYFINYYNLASPSMLQPKTVLPYLNLDSTLGYGYGQKKKLGNCLHEGNFCPPTAHMCHRQTVESMMQLSQRDNEVPVVVQELVH